MSLGLFNAFSHAWSLRGRVVNALAKDSKRNSWAMIDQAVVSLGNFSLAIILARYFESEGRLREYGGFWIFMELMILLNGIQGALAIYPLSVRGAVLPPQRLAAMTMRSLVLTVIGWPVLAFSILATAVVSDLPLRAGIAAGAAIVFWQAQETTRRALMAHLRFQAAVIGDTVSYLGQILLVLVLAHNRTLDLESAFLAVAVTSGAGALIQAWQLRLLADEPKRSGLSSLPRFARDCWKTGHWVLYGNLTGFANGVLFNWALAYFAGLRTVAIYYGLLNLLRLAHPLCFAVATMITPAAARARASEGIRGAREVMWRSATLGAIILVPYLLVTIIAPGWCIELVYGKESEYLAYAPVIRIFALAMAMNYVAVVTGALLMGLEDSRGAFIGQVLFAVAFVLIAIPLAAVYGLTGAAWGWLAAAAMRAVLNAYLVASIERRQAGVASLSTDAPENGNLAAT